MTDTTGLNGHAVSPQTETQTSERSAVEDKPHKAKTQKRRKTMSADEAADVIGVQRHVLKFWEKRFQPDRKSSQRLYKPEDVDFMLGIKALLHGQGCTVTEVQRGLKQHGAEVICKIGCGELKTLPEMGTREASDPIQQDLTGDPEPDLFPDLQIFGAAFKGRKASGGTDTMTSQGVTAPDETLSAEKRGKLEAILETLLEMKAMLADVRYGRSGAGAGGPAAIVKDVTDAVKPPLVPSVEPKVAD